MGKRYEMVKTKHLLIYYTVLIIISILLIWGMVNEANKKQSLEQRNKAVNRREIKGGELL